MRIAVLPRYINLGKKDSVWNERHYILHQYERMATRLGIGLCVIISPYDFEAVCELCDGLIIPGSANMVNPSYYGGEPMNPPPVHDDFSLDLKVADYFVKNEKPVLGICAGLQALNIYFGGTIGLISETERPHSNVTHGINITKDSFVYDVFGSSRATVNSYHVREIKKLGRGLEVVATADDGVIEAVENKEKRIIATQWHPERCFENENSVEEKLFENFLSICAK